MRARPTRRVPVAAEIVTGALVLALPAGAAAAATATVVAQPTTKPVAAAAHKHPRRSRTQLIVRRRIRHRRQGRIASLPGRLVGAHEHARVLLQSRTHHHWTTIGRTRAGRHDGFSFRYRVKSNRTIWLRVRFRGGHGLRPSSAAAGRMIGLAPSVASWYYDAGGTACGFHAGYGVANKTLPCGTHVTFMYHGHTVHATVDDRGPYVAGRSYDLNQNTAQALGMSGVATVETSI